MTRGSLNFLSARTPSLIGHSVGRVEDGVLIVETARVLSDRISDFTQGGYSEELTAVEPVSSSS